LYFIKKIKFWDNNKNTRYVLLTRAFSPLKYIFLSISCQNYKQVVISFISNLLPYNIFLSRFMNFLLLNFFNVFAIHFPTCCQIIQFKGYAHLILIFLNDKSLPLERARNNLFWSCQHNLVFNGNFHSKFKIDILR